VTLRRLRSGTPAMVRLRWRPMPRPEVWVRRDVAGHTLGCRMAPTRPGPEQGLVRCDCYASTWRRWPR
jgi:hypothetical protein